MTNLTSFYTELNKAIEEFEANGMRANVPDELKDDVTWADYKDYEKRAMAFRAGAEFGRQYIYALLNKALNGGRNG